MGKGKRKKKERRGVSKPAEKVNQRDDDGRQWRRKGKLPIDDFYYCARERYSYSAQARHGDFQA